MTATNTATETLQGSIPLWDGFGSVGDIVDPGTIDQSTILTYAVIDPRNYADGQYPRFNAAEQRFDPATITGGGGGLSSTDDLAEGVTNLYYTEARFTTSFDSLTGADLPLSRRLRAISGLNQQTPL